MNKINTILNKIDFEVEGASSKSDIAITMLSTFWSRFQRHCDCNPIIRLTDNTYITSINLLNNYI